MVAVCAMLGLLVPAAPVADATTITLTLPVYPVKCIPLPQPVIQGVTNNARPVSSKGRKPGAIRRRIATSAASMSATGNHILLWLTPPTAFAFTAVMVTCEFSEALSPASVTMAGLKMHVATAGWLPQLKVTVPA